MKRNVPEFSRIVTTDHDSIYVIGGKVTGKFADTAIDSVWEFNIPDNKITDKLKMKNERYDFAIAYDKH